MPNELVSKFQMVSFSIYKANFEVKQKPHHTPLQTKLEFNVVFPDKNVDEMESNVDVHIGLKLKSERKIFMVVKLSIRGYFKGENMSKEQFTELMKYSGVSNLTQIARSYIISMTSQLGIMPPIVLPMINLVEFYKNQKEQ